MGAARRDAGRRWNIARPGVPPWAKKAEIGFCVVVGVDASENYIKFDCKKSARRDAVGKAKWT